MKNATTTVKRVTVYEDVLCKTRPIRAEFVSNDADEGHLVWVKLPDGKVDCFDRSQVFGL